LISRLKAEHHFRQVGACHFRQGEEVVFDHCRLEVVVDHCRLAVVADYFRPSLASALQPHLIEFAEFP
jgi:hypothetical protein